MKAVGSVKRDFSRIVLLLFFFSFFVNILMLTMPLYMLQTYDRILPTQSIDTLIFLSIIAVAALGLLGLLETVRGIIASRAGMRLEASLGGRALQSALNPNDGQEVGLQPVNDLITLRTYLSSRALFAVLDLPFAPLFIGMLYFVHPVLFWMTIGGAALLLLLAIFNQWLTSKPSSKAATLQSQALGFAQSFIGNNETMRAMGMTNNSIDVWGGYNRDSLVAQNTVEIRNNIVTGISRAIRMTIQIAILGVGAWLVVNGQMTAGMIFAASIIAGRGLQPIDQIIGSWKASLGALRAWRRLSSTFGKDANASEKLLLNKPTGAVTASDLVVFASSDPGAPPILGKVSLQAKPGEILVIMGPSGSGKSTLSRILVGAQRAAQGSVRLDNTELSNWNPVQLGENIGYLSQRVELLPGTIAQNIARFTAEVDEADIIAAAEKAGAYALIQSLPDGFQTSIDRFSKGLSGGQLQRIGLARAYFRDPPLLVLDEPNANQDHVGEQALYKSLFEAKQRGKTVIVVSQRTDILKIATKVLFIEEGRASFYGTVPEFLEASREGRFHHKKPNAQSGDVQQKPKPANDVDLPEKRQQGAKASYTPLQNPYALPAKKGGPTNKQKQK